MVAYVYAPDRKAERPEAHLGEFDGILQVDGYGGYAALTRRRQQVRLGFCWAHVRRKFYELADKSPVATEALRRIAFLYAIEDEVRGSPGRNGERFVPNAAASSSTIFATISAPGFVRSASRTSSRRRSVTR